MNNKWKELSKTQKIAYIAMFIIAGITFLCIVLKRTNIINLPFDVTYPGLALVSACEIVQDWNGNRKFAYLAIFSTLFFIVLSVLEFIK